MHIMLVNDDGIYAPGIRAMCDAAIAAGHEVSVCAPDRERSAASHAITLRDALRAEKVDVPGAKVAYAVNGLPADCARLGLYLIPGVDLVISGINAGANMGAACIYSGTVGAATEASMSGTPALAVSLCGFSDWDFEPAARIALKVVDWMMKHPLPRGAIYNLNVPKRPYDDIIGVHAASLAQTYHDSPAYTENDTESGVEYAYAHGVDAIELTDPNCDVLLTRAGYATLTKLWWSLRMEGEDPDVSAIHLREV